MGSAEAVARLEEGLASLELLPIFYPSQMLVLVKKPKILEGSIFFQILGPVPVCLA